jgi:hypothetical protein
MRSRAPSASSRPRRTTRRESRRRLERCGRSRADWTVGNSPTRWRFRRMLASTPRRCAACSFGYPTAGDAGSVARVAGIHSWPNSMPTSRRSCPVTRSTRSRRPRPCRCPLAASSIPREVRRAAAVLELRRARPRSQRPGAARTPRGRNCGREDASSCRAERVATATRGLSRDAEGQGAPRRSAAAGQVGDGIRGEGHRARSEDMRALRRTRGMLQRHYLGLVPDVMRRMRRDHGLRAGAGRR